VTILAVEKQLILYTLSVSYPACAILYCRLWPAWLYRIFPRHVLFVTNFLHIKLFLIFSTVFVRNISYSKKMSERYYLNVHRSSCEVPVVLVRFSKDTKISNFRKNLSIYAEMFHVKKQTDGQAEGR